MAPLRKAASQASITRSASAESADTQQSGRSPSALSAEKAAATLHQHSTSNLRASSSPNLLGGQSAHQVQTSGPSSSPSTVPSSTLHPSSHKRPHTSHVPQISSPLSVNSSSESIGGNVEDTDQRRASDGSKSSSDHATASQRHLPPLRPQLRAPTINPGLTLEPRHSTSTLTLKDLGSDYTRYFSPYSASARTSYSEAPPSPVSRYSSAGNNRSTTHLLAAAPVNPFTTPNASTTNLNSDHDPEKHGGALIDDRLNAPYNNEKGAPSWPLFTDAPEDDDDMHMPHPDDDIKYRPKFKDHFSRGNMASTIGLLLMAVGLLFVFIGLPVLSFTGILVYSGMYSTPLDQMPGYWAEGEAWAIVNKSRSWPLLANIRTSLIDRDTPKSAMTKIGEYGEELELVFSDEFNVPNRTFYEGDDPFWFAPDIWYGATQDLEWYDPDAVTTWDGTLELRLDKFVNHGLNYRSGMLNSWNHLCFKGGIFEVSVSLPGPAAVMGLWPGAWTMGNLGRPGYLSTTEGMWPYTYQACDVGITPNQSSHDGLSRLPGQRLPSCTCPGEDHPTPGKGRGAPEIDIIEAGASWGGLPIATQSYQVAPFDIWWYPNYNFTAFPDYAVSYTNGYTGGPFQQAVSATTNLNKQWFDGKQYQTYSFEYVPGEGEKSYIVWKVGGQTTFMIDGRAIGPNGNIQARQISEEPMSMILNLGFSNSWTNIDWPNLVFPTVMRVDHVRLYQKKGQKMVTCDPPGFETTQYIKDHMAAYTNPNFTKWDQTGYGWPKHKLNSQC